MDFRRISLGIAAVLGPLCFVVVQGETTSGGLLLFVQAVLMVNVIVGIAHGADWLVDSACRLAQALGISHLVIGLTIVAFGTSAPEIAASLLAGFRGNGDIAVANVVGSNVFNICFILGGVALILPQGLEIQRPLVTRDAPMLLFGTVLLFVFVGGLSGTVQPETPAGFAPELLNLRLEQGEGVILLVLLVSYLALLYFRGGDGEADEEDFGKAGARDVPLFLLGLFCVVGGCHLLVGHAELLDGELRGFGALWFARLWNVPDHIVGITIIAAGTSAPELVVSLVAAMRGAFGLSAGNLIGSDIFNFYGVIGLSGVLLQEPAAPPVVLSPALVTGVIAPIVIVFVTIIVMRTGLRITRREGALLIVLGLARWATDFASLA